MPSPMDRFGGLLKEWRASRGTSQLKLAALADISQRHLSFVESGRSRPSEELVLKLSEILGLGLRARNELLVAAGFAPRFGEGSWDRPALGFVRKAARLLLESHEPNPGFVLDAASTILDANGPALALLQATPEVLGRVNLVELVFAPGPVRDAIVNFDEVGGFLLARLREAAAYRGPGSSVRAAFERASALARSSGLSPNPVAIAGVLLLLEFRVAGEVRRWYTTVTTFGAPQDAFVEEITVELFHPYDGPVPVGRAHTEPRTR